MERDSRAIVRRLEAEGYRLVRISGSHHVFVHPVSRRRVVLPHPRKDLPIGTLRAIYKDAGWLR